MSLSTSATPAALATLAIWLCIPNCIVTMFSRISMSLRRQSATSPHSLYTKSRRELTWAVSEAIFLLSSHLDSLSESLRKLCGCPLSGFLTVRWKWRGREEDYMAVGATMGVGVSAGAGAGTDFFPGACLRMRAFPYPPPGFCIPTTV